MRLWNCCCLGAVIAALVMAGGCKSRPPSREALVRQGDELVAKKQYREAAIAYFDANKVGPPDAKLLLKEADAAVEAGQLRAADRAATKVADLQPDDMSVQLLAARLKLSQRGFDEVRARMSAILSKQPDNAQVLVELGNARSHNSLPLSGLLQFSGARNKDEFDGMAFKALTGSGAVGGVTGFTDTDLKASERAFRKAAALDPKTPDTQLALANFLWRAGRADEHPESRVANLALGAYYSLVERNDEAVPYLKVAAANPAKPQQAGAGGGETGGAAGRSTASSVLIELYLRTKRDEEALALLTKELPSNPARVGLRLAEVEFRTGKRDEALRRVDALLAQTPKLPRATEVKAHFLLEMHQTDKAVALARAAAAEDPQSGSAKARLGQVLLATGDPKGAFDEYKAAARLDPGEADAFTGLAAASLALGRGQDALLNAREAARLKPGDRAAAVAVVKALILSEDTSGAEQALAPLVSQTPASPDVLVLTGQLNAARGNKAAARAAFTKALQLSTDSADATAGLAALDSKQKPNAAAR